MVLPRWQTGYTEVQIDTDAPAKRVQKESNAVMATEQQCAAIAQAGNVDAFTVLQRQSL